MNEYFHRYGFLGSLHLVLSKIFTICFYPKSRLIRLPIDVRNRRNIDFGTNLTCGRYCRIEAHPDKSKPKQKTLFFGDNVQLNDYVHIVAAGEIVIGSNVLMASKIFISDSNHGTYQGHGQSHPDVPPMERPLSISPVRICDNVWIGEFVTILPGVTIGKGSIIGALSVVTKNIPAYSIAVGSPARVIKRYNFQTKEWERA